MKRLLAEGAALGLLIGAYQARRHGLDLGDMSVSPGAVGAAASAPGAVSTTSTAPIEWMWLAWLWMPLLGAVAGAVVYPLVSVEAWRGRIRSDRGAQALAQASAVDRWFLVPMITGVGALFFEAFRFWGYLALYAGGATIKMLAVFPLLGLLRRGETWRGLLVSGWLCLILFLGLEVSVRVYLNRTRQTLEMLASIPTRFDPGREVHLGEIIVRNDNPRLLFSGAPGAAGILKGAPVRLNSMGFRGPEWTRAKPPGVFRIAGIGDSFMFGWGVALEDCFLSQVERDLNATSGPLRYEALNFGLFGYNTVQELEVVTTHALAFDPDLILWQYFGNDRAAPYLLPKKKDYLRAGGCVTVDLIAKRLAALRLARENKSRGKQSLLDLGLRINPDDMIDSPEDLEDFPEEYKYLTGWDNFEQAMAALGDISKRRNIPVAMFAMAHAGRRVKHVERLQEIARRNGIHFHDVSGELNAAIAATGRPPMDFWVGDPDFHYNAEANRMVADILTRQLRAWGLVQKSGADMKDPPMAEPSHR